MTILNDIGLRLCWNVRLVVVCIRQEDVVRQRVSVWNSGYESEVIDSFHKHVIHGPPLCFVRGVQY